MLMEDGISFVEPFFSCRLTSIFLFWRLRKFPFRCSWNTTGWYFLRFFFKGIRLNSKGFSSFFYFLFGPCIFDEGYPVFFSLKIAHSTKHGVKTLYLPHLLHVLTCLDHQRRGLMIRDSRSLVCVT